MDTLSVAETKTTLSEQLRNIDDSPVRITKNGKPIAVLISDARYKEMKKIEDLLYIKMAEVASQEGFLSTQESEDLNSEIMANG